MLRRTINGRVVRDQPECSRDGPRFDGDGGDITGAFKVAGDGRRRAGVMMRRGLTFEVRVATFGALVQIWLVVPSQNNSDLEI